jgi:hypothetical protein
VLDAPITLDGVLYPAGTSIWTNEARTPVQACKIFALFPDASQHAMALAAADASRFEGTALALVL